MNIISEKVKITAQKTPTNQSVKLTKKQQKVFDYLVDRYNSLMDRYTNEHPGAREVNKWEIKELQEDPLSHMGSAVLFAGLCQAGYSLEMQDAVLYLKPKAIPLMDKMEEAFREYIANNKGNVPKTECTEEQRRKEIEKELENVTRMLNKKIHISLPK